MRESTEVVTAPCGPVRGSWRPTTSPAVRSAAFLGIPFAQPPVGALRFQAPVRMPPWTHVLDATRPGPTPQRRTGGELTTIPEPSFAGEATLNVNVFTPAPGDESALLPVFVWIHGGGYFAGSPSSPWYDGAAFNRDGVVTVSISYRLGFDGFGWMEGAPLNRGLRDQLCALDWVRDNITAFGGDPRRVTIGGQSAGGGSVLTLLGSPAAQTLFRGAVSQSGAVADLPYEVAERLGRRMAASADIQPTWEAWSQVDHDRILDLEAAARAEDGMMEPLAMLAGGARLGFAPVVDGEILLRPSIAAIAAGQGSKVRLLAGTTEHEFTGMGEALAGAIGDGTAEDLLISAGWEPDRAAAFTERHASLGSEALIAGQAITAGTFTDCLTRVLDARTEADPDTQTWAYRFTWPWPDGLSSHCLEIPFVFDHLDAERVEQSLGKNPPQALADAMHGDWVAFITGRDPAWRQWGPEQPRERRTYGHDVALESV
ncbi:carboxylesterase/lipase family protein [Microbacterium sp.]|uniref:carboxylesterase/lipase family protein n=1 Tax=Microbacterium sp. TaxID=51671 RepID=UPI0039E448DC